jgi:hypothetical protein
MPAVPIWVRIVSWHVLKFDDPNVTACGLEVGEDDEIHDHLPTDFWQSKSCENCFRHVMTAKEIWEASIPA